MFGTLPLITNDVWAAIVPKKAISWLGKTEPDAYPIFGRRSATKGGALGLCDKDDGLNLRRGSTRHVNTFDGKTQASSKRSDYGSGFRYSR